MRCCGRFARWHGRCARGPQEEAMANDNPTPTTTEIANVKHLNQLLKGELAAAASYDNALEHVANPRVRTRLEQNRRSHVDRVVLIAQLIREAGGEPVQTAGTWGAIAKLYERGAALLGEHMLLRALHEGERAWGDMYGQWSRGTRGSEDSWLVNLTRQQRETEVRLAELMN
jgi:hypothetical protein